MLEKTIMSKRKISSDRENALPKYQDEKRFCSGIEIDEDNDWHRQFDPKIKKEVNEAMDLSSYNHFLQENNFYNALIFYSRLKKIGSENLAQAASDFLEKIDLMEQEKSLDFDRFDRKVLKQVKNYLQKGKNLELKTLENSLKVISLKFSRIQSDKNLEKITKHMEIDKREVMRNLFHNALCDEKKPDFVQAFYQITVAKERKYEEFAEMKNKFLKMIDKYLLMGDDFEYKNQAIVLDILKKRAENL